MTRLRVVIDATDPRLARDLAAGGAFVTGYDLSLQEECELVVRTADAEILLDARVVYLDPQRGAGLELVGFCNAIREQLAALIGTSELDSAKTTRLPRMASSSSPPTEQRVSASKSTGASPSIVRPLTGSSPPATRTRTESSPLIVRLSPTGSSPAITRTLTPGSSPAITPAGSSPGIPRAGSRTTSSPSLPRAPTPGDRSTRSAVAATAIAAARRASLPGAVAEGSTPQLGLGSESRVRVAAVDEAESYDDLEIEIAPGSPDLEAAETAEATDATDATDDADNDREDESPAARTLSARLRGLNFAEQIRLAGTGDINERIILERLYGKNVWEALLRNPRLTAPEVARIARMGALPRVMIEVIVANGGWLQMPDVRRALLSNPRLGTDQITKILRLMPKPELRLVPTQTALPFAVRDVARRVLRGGT